MSHDARDGRLRQPEIPCTPTADAVLDLDEIASVR
jgi:hypothetical protein